MAVSDTRAILPDPPPALKAISHRLTEKIRAAMASGDRLSFAQFMEMALYEPGLGYYSAGLHKLGESGDFTTAPELGNLFARCLARQSSQVAAALGSWSVLEIGAGTGRMAADFLNAFDPDDGPDRYRILERSADLRATQERMIATEAPNWVERVEWLDEPPGTPWQGVILANEVIDALPVERFRIREQGIAQVGVREDAETLTWDWWSAPEDLARRVTELEASLHAPLPRGYTSEICTMLEPWLGSVTRQLTRGLALFIDYGYPRNEYYLPQRADGTLVCHYRHRAHDDPFFWPGLQDLTAFVDFTALAEAAHARGLDVSGYTTQAMFLVGCGLEELLQTLPDLPEREAAELSRQVRHLTLPGAMGEKFQVMALSRDLDIELRGFALQQWLHRL